jgi:hypothetical protein
MKGAKLKFGAGALTGEGPIKAIVYRCPYLSLKETQRVRRTLHFAPFRVMVAVVLQVS